MRIEEDEDGYTIEQLWALIFLWSLVFWLSLALIVAWLVW